MFEQRKIIIVGAGISGLTTATSLARRGVDVTLIEKNPICGGLVNSFERDGFIFDGGVRAIENAGMIKPMLEELEIDLKLYESKVSVGIEDKIIHVIDDDSINDYERLLKDIYPESTHDVEKVIEVIKKFDTYMQVLFGSDSPFFKDITRDKKYYFTTFISWIFRFLITGRAVMKTQMPVEEFLHDLIDDQSLFDIISQHFFKHTPAFFAMSYFSLYTDYYYPEGGVGQLAVKLEEQFVAQGGTLLKNTDITQVDLRKKTLSDQNDRSYEYDKLIWCADLKQLYRSISTEGLSTKIASSIDKEQQAILSCRGAESVFTVFMGIDESPEYFSKISHGHFFYTPSKKGLGELQRSTLSTLLDDWENTSKEQILTWLDPFCQLNTFEISLPVLNDPKTAPKGKTGLIVSFLLDYELVRRIREDGWYDELKTYIEKKVINILEQSIYPGLQKSILFSFSSSPLTIEKQVRSSEGAIVGWSFEEPVPVNPGILKMKDSVKTTLPDVFKAGQWAASPAGIPTCILTAKLAADLVYKELS